MTDSGPGISVKIDPEELDKLLSDAVLHSAFGSRIVQKLQEEFGGKYKVDQLVSTAIDDAVRREVMRMLGEGEVAELLRAKVKQALEGALTDDVVARLTMAAIEVRSSRY